LLLALPLAAQAEMYQCRDARGVMQFSDKPLPGCKGRVIAKPAPPAPVTPVAAKPPATPAAAAKPAAKVEAPKDPVRLASRCKTLREQRDWLLGPRGRDVTAHDARLWQVEQALRECP
jgi:hypothetical protein